MAYYLPSRITTALLLSGSLLLSACCANNECNCQDEQADAINLKFSNAFTAAELDTIIIQRSPLPYSRTNKAEQVTLIRTAARARDTLRLNNTTPFAQVGTTKLNGYRYEIQYLTQQPKNKPVATTVLVLDSVVLRGRFEGTGCCTCYTNIEKRVVATKPKLWSTAKDSTFTVNLNQTPVLEITK